MISGLYAGLLAILFVYLSIKVIKLRIKYQVGIGDGGHEDLALAIRVQGNFAEYIPIALILLAMAEIAGAPIAIVHGFGGLIVLSRGMHAHGLARSKGATKTRKGGMLITFFSLIGLAVTNIGFYLF